MMKFESVMKLDTGVVSALANYLMLGFHPGNFGVALLLGDEDLTYRCAHSLLKPIHDGDEDIVRNMLDFVRAGVPNEAKGSNYAITCWMARGGFSDPSLDTSMIMVEMKLKETDCWWDPQSYF